jgi:hypothetical protein
MCSRESLLGDWIDPWMCSLVVDGVSHVDRPFSTGGQLMCHEEMYRQMQYY